MADIFTISGSDTNRVGGVFNGTGVGIALATATPETDGALKFALVQSIQIQYQRSINRIVELGSEATYYVIGRSQGTATLQNIVGPNRVVSDIIDRLGNACEAIRQTLNIVANTDFCAAEGSNRSGGLSFTMSGPVLTSVGMSLSVQDFTLVQTATVEFAGLSKINLSK